MTRTLLLSVAFLTVTGCWVAADSLGASDAKRPDQAKKESIKGKGHLPPSTLLLGIMSKLHSEAYTHFIEREGFGKSRLIPTVELVKREWKMPDWTSEELAKGHSRHSKIKDLELIHRYGIDAFRLSVSDEANPYGKLMAPKKETLWEIKSIDLIGLVLHAEPVVYVSEKVPEMMDLKKHPTRDMDMFETEGLEELRTGKTIYLRTKHETIRMLGPLTAGKACMKCHDVNEGQLLGAFSYTLRPGEYRITPRFRPPAGEPLPAKK